MALINQFGVNKPNKQAANTFGFGVNKSALALTNLTNKQKATDTFSFGVNKSSETSSKKYTLCSLTNARRRNTHAE